MSELVGLLGIEPSLPAPKAGVLPVYDSPINLAGQEAGAPVPCHHCEAGLKRDYTVFR